MERTRIPYHIYYIPYITNYGHVIYIDGLTSCLNKIHIDFHLARHLFPPIWFERKFCA